MMKKSVIIILVSLSLLRPIPAKADLFGGDVIVLTKILMNALQQLIQLKRIVDTGRNQFDLVREINRGMPRRLHELVGRDPGGSPLTQRRGGADRRQVQRERQAHPRHRAHGHTRQSPVLEERLLPHGLQR